MLTKGALEDYIAAQGREYEVAYNEAQEACKAIINAENQKGNAVRDTTAAIYEQIYALARAAELAYITQKVESGRDIDTAEKMWARSSQGKYWISNIGTANRAIEAEHQYNTFQALAKTLSTGNQSGSKSGSSSGKSEAEKAQEQHIKDLKKAAQQAKKEAKAERDEQVKAIQAEIDALKKRNDEEKEALELEEKRADVLKKQAELEKAKSQRTIRVWNRATRTWESVADATKVQSAEEALEKAKSDLAEYRRKKEQEAEIEALEARKKAINELYEQTTKQIDDALEQLDEPVENLSGLFSELGVSIEGFKTSLEELGIVTEEAEEEIATGGGGAGVGSGLNPVEGTYTIGSNGEYIFNGYRRRDDDPDKVLKDGKWEAFHTVHDLGGILRGRGSLKATERDEIIVPPNIADKMLSPSADAAFQRRMSELNFIYGGGVRPEGRLRSGISGSVTNNNGSTYNLGGITLTEGQARTTTVYQLAQLAHGLKCYS